MSDDLIQLLTEQSRAIGRIEGQLEKLVGNGQPGIVKEMQDDIKQLESSRNYALGFGAGLIFIEGAYHYMLHRLGLK